MDELERRVHELGIALGAYETTLRPVEIQHPRPHDFRRRREAEEYDHPPLLGEAALEKTECEIEHVLTLEPAKIRSAFAGCAF
jgi:hypothetical protein